MWPASFKRRRAAAALVVVAILGGCGDEVGSASPGVASPGSPSAGVPAAATGVPSPAAVPKTTRAPVIPARDLRTAPPGRFYEVEGADLEGPAGSLIRSLELDAPGGTRAWAVLYRTTGQDGSTVPVSGLVLAPDAPLPPGQDATRQVIAWAHGTTGLADGCAPSREGVSGVGFAPIVELIRQGFVIAATDYEGLGTPGIHPYLVGSSEGRSILDSLRAARALADVGAGNRAAIVGISQGGHAAIWAAELVEAYAPELDVVGAVAASPPMDLRAVQRAVLGGADAGAVAWLESLMVAAAWRSIYDAPLDGLLTDQAMRIVRELEDACPSSIEPPTRNPFRVDPATVPEWQALLQANSPGHRPSRSPILVLAATDDSLVPASTIASGIDRLCAAGSSVNLRWIEGPHEATLATPAAATMAFSWTMDRLRGAPAANGCA